MLRNIQDQGELVIIISLLLQSQGLSEMTVSLDFVSMRGGKENKRKTNVMREREDTLACKITTVACLRQQLLLSSKGLMCHNIYASFSFVNMSLALEISALEGFPSS